MPGGVNQRKVLPKNASVSGVLTMHKKCYDICIAVIQIEVVRRL